MCNQGEWKDYGKEMEDESKQLVNSRLITPILFELEYKESKQNYVWLSRPLIQLAAALD